MKIEWPLAMRFTPYIIFCRPNANISARGPLISALIANITLFNSLLSASLAHIYAKRINSTSETTANTIPITSK